MDSLLSIHSTIMDSFLSTQEVLDESTLILLGSEARRKGAKLTYFHHASGHFVLVKLEDTGFYNRQMRMLKNCYQVGRIARFERGKHLCLGDITLHPIFFEFKIFTQNYRSEVNCIPYFFRDATTCECVFQWLLSPAPAPDRELSLVDEEAWSRSVSKQELVEDLSKIVRKKKGLMIYWDHLCQKFAYMQKKDSNSYRREMCMLKRCLHVSRAPNTCHIEQGTILELGDVSLYPLLFGFMTNIATPRRFFN